MSDPIQEYALNAIYEKHYSTIESIIDTEDKEIIDNALNDAYESGLTRGIAEHPRYTRIDIEGRDGCYAIYRKKPESNTITTEVLTPGVNLTMKTPVDDTALQMESADLIYELIQGGEPAIDELDCYLRPFEHLACNKNTVRTNKETKKEQPSLEKIAIEHSGVMNDKLPEGYSPIEYLEDMGELEYEISELVQEGKEYLAKNKYDMASLIFKDVSNLQSIHDSLTEAEIKEVIDVVEIMDTAARDHIPNRLYSNIYKMKY